MYFFRPNTCWTIIKSISDLESEGKTFYFGGSSNLALDYEVCSLVVSAGATSWTNFTQCNAGDITLELTCKFQNNLWPWAQVGSGNWMSGDWVGGVVSNVIPDSNDKIKCQTNTGIVKSCARCLSNWF